MVLLISKMIFIKREDQNKDLFGEDFANKEFNLIEEFFKEKNKPCSFLFNE